jgi:hypothetical protein
MMGCIVCLAVVLLLIERSKDWISKLLNERCIYTQNTFKVRGSYTLTNVCLVLTAHRSLWNGELKHLSNRSLESNEK